jgi:asparagine synthase (glutamine-hydrolysing)
MKRHIPEVVTQTEKQGFSAPDASWFKGDSIEFVKRTLLGKNSHIYSFLDKSTVEILVKEHLNGTENRRLLIWSLLNVEQWLKEKAND